MTAEKIFRDADGNRFKVKASYYHDLYHEHEWALRVSKCEKGKRTFVALFNPDNYRNLSGEEERKQRLALYASLIPWGWVREVQREVLDAIKGTIDELSPEEV